MWSILIALALMVGGYYVGFVEGFRQGRESTPRIAVTEPTPKGTGMTVSYHEGNKVLVCHWRQVPTVKCESQ